MSAFLTVTAIALATAGSAAAECQSILEAVSANGLTRLGEAVTAVQDLSGAEILVQAVTATEELPEESKVTVFAPNNAAWPPAADLPTGGPLLSILAGHVVPSYLPSTAVLSALSDANEVAVPSLAGSDVIATQNGTDIYVAAEGQMPPAKVVAFDVETCAGVVHVINKVLIPVEEAMGPDSLAPQGAPCTSLADAITENGLMRLGEAVLSVLEEPTAAALKSLALEVNELPEDQKITLFAPNDTAWPAAASLPKGDDLLDILLGHVVPDYLPSSDVIAAVSAMEIVSLPTLDMTELNVTMEGSSVYIAAEGMEEPGAQVIALDIETCVGVVHVVDKVLLAGVEPMDMTSGDMTDGPQTGTGGNVVDTVPLVPATPSAAASDMFLGIVASVVAAAAMFV